MKEVAVDTDFLNHIVETTINEKEKSIYEVIEQVFKELEMCPIMHELVFKNEVEGGADNSTKEKVMTLFSQGIVRKKEINTFVKEEAERKYYNIIFNEIYRDFRGVSIEKDVLEYWKSRASFGETHTAVMCFMIKCGIMLSDDKGSRKLANILRSRVAFELIVENRKEFISRLQKIKGTSIDRPIRRALVHKSK